MDTYKMLSSAMEVLRYKLTGKKVPLSVTHYITYQCNYRCDYCDIWNTDSEEMGTDEVKRMIDEFSEAGTKRMGFTGGEPLLRDDIGEVITYAKDRGMVTTLCSNGELLHDRIDDLQDLDVVQISLDGKKETHEKVRKGSDYGKIMRSIDTARDRDMDVVTSTVITKENIDEIDYILDLGKRKGLIPSFKPVYSFSLDGTVGENMPSREEMGEVIGKIIDAKESGYRVMNSKTLLRHVKENWPDFNNCKICLASDLFCIVDVDGTVYPCQPDQDMEGRNGLDEGFGKAFHNISSPEGPGCWCDSFLDISFMGNLGVEPIYNTADNFFI